MKINEKYYQPTSLPDLKVDSIYFLLSGQQVVYVGQSIRPYNRIFHHGWKRKIEFDKYVIVPLCDLPFDDLDSAEAHFISRHRPKHNQTIPSNSMYASVTEIIIAIHGKPNKNPVTTKKKLIACIEDKFNLGQNWYFNRAEVQYKFKINM